MSSKEASLRRLPTIEELRHLPKDPKMADTVEKIIQCLSDAKSARSLKPLVLQELQLLTTEPVEP